MKTNNTTVKKNTHIKVAKGVYKYPTSRTYVVRPTVKFTTKAAAVAYYKSL